MLSWSTTRKLWSAVKSPRVTLINDVPNGLKDLLSAFTSWMCPPDDISGLPMYFLLAMEQEVPAFVLDCYACYCCAVVNVCDGRNVLCGASTHFRPRAFPARWVEMLHRPFPWSQQLHARCPLFPQLKQVGTDGRRILQFLARWPCFPQLWQYTASLCCVVRAINCSDKPCSVASIWSSLVVVAVSWTWLTKLGFAASVRR